MTILYRTLFCLLFTTLPFTIVAQESSMSETAEVITQIIEDTGIANRVTQTPREVKSQFESNPFGLEPSKNKRMIDLFAKAFVDDTLMDKVKNTFKDQYNAQYAQTTATWLMEEPTQEVLEAERAIHTLQGSRKRVVRMYELEQDPPSAERKKMIQSLIDATSAYESTVTSQVILFRSIVSAFSMLSDQQTFSETQIDGIVNNYRLQIKSQVEQEITNQLMIMYYDLDSNTLNDYISFYQSEAGNWLSSTANDGIHSAFEAAANRFIESVKSTE